jgi:hypothetical protein
MFSLKKKFPRLIAALRPSLEEVDSYARIILHHEGRPPSALPDCRKEAELQLWAGRAFDGHYGLTESRRPRAG